MTDLKLVLPKGVATAQAGRERRQSMLRAIEAGAHASELAANVGVSLSRLQSLLRKARTERADRSPIEAYFAQYPFRNSW